MNITKKDNPEEFDRLCAEFAIEHPSTVHHFAWDAESCSMSPVEWTSIEVEKSSTERTLHD